MIRLCIVLALGSAAACASHRVGGRAEAPVSGADQPSPAPANLVLIDVRVEVKGKAVHSQRVELTEGEKGAFTVTAGGTAGEQGISVEVRPRLIDASLVELDCTVIESRDGRRSVLARPRIVTPSGTVAWIEQAMVGEFPVRLTMTPTAAPGRPR